MGGGAGDYRPHVFPDTTAFLRRLAALSRPPPPEPSPPAAAVPADSSDEELLAAALFDWQVRRPARPRCRTCLASLR